MYFAPRTVRQFYNINQRNAHFYINVLIRNFFGAFCMFQVHPVAQFIEALRYKPEGRGFDSRWCHWNFSLT